MDELNGGDAFEMDGESGIHIQVEVSAAFEHTTSRFCISEGHGKWA